MPLQSKESLHQKLADEKFREAFISSRIGQTVAAQVRVFRQREKLSQKDLARELGTSQNAIYRLENPKYGKHNISTLKKTAKFFRVGLVVRFAAISEIVDWTLGLSERSINVPAFADDPGFERRPVASDHREQVAQVAVGEQSQSRTRIVVNPEEFERARRKLEGTGRQQVANPAQAMGSAGTGGAANPSASTQGTDAPSPKPASNEGGVQRTRSAADF